MLPARLIQCCRYMLALDEGGGQADRWQGECAPAGLWRPFVIFLRPDPCPLTPACAGGGAQTEAGMRSSKFCAHIVGDTPSASRLFHALVSACVPVIISDAIDLPMEDALNYARFALSSASRCSSPSRTPTQCLGWDPSLRTSLPLYPEIRKTEARRSLPFEPSPCGPATESLPCVPALSGVVAGCGEEGSSGGEAAGGGGGAVDGHVGGAAQSAAPLPLPGQPLLGLQLRMPRLL